MTEDPRSDFESLVTTIGSIYELRGIGVSYVKVCRDIWEWLFDQDTLAPFGKSYNSAEQCFSEADVRIRHRMIDEDKHLHEYTITIKPYGADRRIPVGIKTSGNNPWSITVEYKKED